MLINYQADTIDYLDITFDPKWDYIPLTRVFIQNFLLVNLTDRENIHKIEIAAAELLENAIKYSDQAGIRMKINKSDAREITLSVYNFVNKEKADKVERLVQEMAQQNSFEYYVKKLKQSVKNSHSSAGIGLARIYHEANAIIQTLYFEKDKVLEINAIFK